MMAKAHLACAKKVLVSAIFRQFSSCFGLLNCRYNTRTLSENIKFMCMSFRNREKSQSLAKFSSLFPSECKLILYLTTMNVYCVYSAIYLP
jgi:hypothetical protein